jgi:adenine C2-methylase RlmN of 23S rRNA A2503 and tRNA A37
LKAAEIIGQLITAKKSLFDFPAAQDRVVSNIVFMGQGEPVSETALRYLTQMLTIYHTVL